MYTDILFIVLAIIIPTIAIYHIVFNNPRFLAFISFLTAYISFWLLLHNNITGHINSILLAIAYLLFTLILFIALGKLNYRRRLRSHPLYFLIAMSKFTKRYERRARRRAFFRRIFPAKKQVKEFCIKWFGTKRQKRDQQLMKELWQEQYNYFTSQKKKGVSIADD